MKKRSVHITLTLPEDVKMLLYTTVEKGAISKFVADSLRKSLREKQNELANAYRDAAKDLGQLEAINDWKELENEDFLGVEWNE